MSLSICDYCGGHIPLGPCASNRCEECGRSLYCQEPLQPVSGIGDSELVVLRQEVAMLRVENELLKKRERDRWENADSAFGKNPSRAEFMNLPMNPNDMGGDWSSLGTRRPGDF